MWLFKVIFYTKGSFVKDERLRYDGGDVYALSGQDSDFWSFFEVCDLIKGIDSSLNIDDVKLWWKHEYGCLEKDLKPFVNDEDATVLVFYTEKSNCDVEIYTEPRSSSGEKTYMERYTQSQDYQAVRRLIWRGGEEEIIHDFDEDIDDGLNIGVDNCEYIREPDDDAGTSQ
ncbi:hypothetical protein KIW84_071084 [Lathyrus oleraceus]|uniref:PB1-like domain-containing protein n=1 Tax=Pisum sativum TaxID=3888 RepID=A0A9D4ZVJ1_PEA|nr:hypothetical protein KIW84_071084 [Pisum sativum]